MNSKGTSLPARNGLKILPIYFRCEEDQSIVGEDQSIVGEDQSIVGEDQSIVDEDQSIVVDMPARFSAQF